LDNWVTWLDLHCQNHRLLGFFGSLYFAGNLCSSLIFPALADKYGRRNIFMFGASMQFLTMATMAFVKILVV
jgi:MFS family permease